MKSRPEREPLGWIRSMRPPQRTPVQGRGLWQPGVCWRLPAIFLVVPDLRQTAELVARIEGMDRSGELCWGGTRSFCFLLICLLCRRSWHFQQSLCANFPTNLLHNFLPQFPPCPRQFVWRLWAVTRAAQDAFFLPPYSPAVVLPARSGGKGQRGAAALFRSAGARPLKWVYPNASKNPL